MAQSAASLWAAGGDTFSKSGMGYDDHHMKSPDGKFSRSPPTKLKGMYDYLPNDSSPKKVPVKVVLQGESPESQRATLGVQTRCVCCIGRG